MSKVEKTEPNKKKCFCSNCPSYNECTKKNEETLYCAGDVGKSVCKINMNGCLCGGCPVHRENNLKSGYYCMNGSADQIDDKTLM